MAEARRRSRARVFFVSGISFFPLGLTVHPACVGIGSGPLVAGMTHLVRERTAADRDDE